MTTDRTQTAQLRQSKVRGGALKARSTGSQLPVSEGPNRQRVHARTVVAKSPVTKAAARRRWHGAVRQL